MKKVVIVQLFLLTFYTYFQKAKTDNIFFSTTFYFPYLQYNTTEQNNEVYFVNISNKITAEKVLNSKHATELKYFHCNFQ